MARRARKSDKLDPAALPGALASGVPPVVVISGPEDFLRREAIETIRRHLGPDAEIERRSERSPNEDSLVALFDDLRTPDLFGGRRALVLEPADRWLSAGPELWISALERPWPEGHLVVVADTIDGRTKVAKALASAGIWVQVERPFHRPPPWKPGARPWENDMNRWIIARARTCELRIDPPVAHLLQERIGPRLADLAAAIDRLSTVLGGEKGATITEERVVEHTPDGAESNLFEVVDALFLGDRAAALRCVQDLLSRGSVEANGTRTTDPTALLLQCVGAALSRARQLRRWHAASGRGLGDEEIAREVGVARPFIPRLRAQANQMPPPALRRTIDRLLRADSDLKSGSGPNAAELLERLAVGA